MADSAAILVLGMHRSGTSALAHVLKLGGADLGSRVLGASAGNEMGHWEDALAVEIHERLLAGFGARWDEPFALPADWAVGEAARSARETIRGYIASNRSRQPLWVAKDPRLSLFAGLWREAAVEQQVPMGAILMLRHPMEVARSLAARDGIALGRGMLLWLDYTLAAAREAEQLPCVVLQYGQLLTNWRGCIERSRMLPGGAKLVYDAAAQSAVDGALDRGLRHHSDTGAEGLPPVVAEVWETLSGLSREGALPLGTSERLSRLAHPVRELLHPLLDEARVTQRLLWERIGHGEARLVELTESSKALPIRLEELRERIDRQRDEHERSIRELERSREMSRRETAELRVERDRLLDLANQFEQLKTSRSWRWTRPLRFAHRAVTGQMTPAEGSTLRRMARNVVAKTPLLGNATRSRLIEQTLAMKGGQAGDLPDASMAHMIRLADQQQGMPDVFVWSVIDWHFRTQRPQHLARALAEKGHRVFYISVNFIDSAQAGFHVEPLDNQGRLFQIHLHLVGAPLIYSDMPTLAQTEALHSSLGQLLAWTCTQRSVSLIQHPYWSELTRAVPNASVVYDCMDHHAGFENNATEVIEAERRMIDDADLVIVTSSWLHDEIGESAHSIATIRNACEFEFFRNAPPEVFRDELHRPVIGYYGAISEWFDVSLVRRVARENPGSLVLLIGHDSIGAAAFLAGLPNVRMTGEIPYKELPYWLHGFDVCLLPFKVVPLTLATNPVKIYEYLSAGKPVVAVDLPEMVQFGELIRVASDEDAFVKAVANVLAGETDPAIAQKRQAFAAEQTWLHRADALDAVLRDLDEPRVSLVVLTYNNLALTQECLSSIEALSDYRNLQVIVVDNASTDGSPDFLKDWVAQASPAGHQRKLILGDTNRGFAAGNNIGLAAADGEVLVMLNNDTHVTPGWIRTLCNHLRRDPSLGLIGPVTNNIGNEARIEISYADMGEMVRLAGEYTRRHPGKAVPIQTVAFFCVAMPRAVYASVGGLDEAFGQGFFEDDDYCRRVQMAGWKVAYAEDVFVHHHLSASFNRVDPERRKALFERNKAIYEVKWGAWQPHAYRNTDS